MLDAFPSLPIPGSGEDLQEVPGVSVVATARQHVSVARLIFNADLRRIYRNIYVIEIL